MTLELDNTSDQWKNYNFYMAKVHAYLKMQTSVASPATTDELLDENYDPILIGQIGLPGTNSGAREGDSYGLEVGLPTGTNPVSVGMPIFLWPRAVEDAKKLTATNAGVKGAPALRHNIKFIWNTQSNTLINQHGGINQIRPILEDDTKVETIVCVDTQMTPSTIIKFLTRWYLQI